MFHVGPNGATTAGTREEKGEGGYVLSPRFFVQLAVIF